MLKEAEFSLLELLKDLSSLIKDIIPAQPSRLRVIKFLRRKGYVLNHFFQPSLLANPAVQYIL